MKKILCLIIYFLSFSNIGWTQDTDLKLVLVFETDQSIPTELKLNSFVNWVAAIKTYGQLRGHIFEQEVLQILDSLQIEKDTSGWNYFKNKINQKDSLTLAIIRRYLNNHSFLLQEKLLKAIDNNQLLIFIKKSADPSSFVITIHKHMPLQAVLHELRFTPYGQIKKEDGMILKATGEKAVTTLKDSFYSQSFIVNGEKTLEIKITINETNLNSIIIP